MKRIFTGLTDTGRVRSVNQDDFYNDPEGRFFIVADGMGGHAGGEEASKLATKTIKEYLLAHWDSDKSSDRLLKAALLKANDAIIEDQRQHPERSDMGTTAVVLLFRKSPEQEREEPWVAHIGDSRLYRLRGHTLQQITLDHTWVAKAMASGVLDPEQGRTHPWRHVLSQCLGREDTQDEDIDVDPIELQGGDRLLLCSDGLTEELPDGTIASTLKSIRACDMAGQKLIEQAKEKGGRDNITVTIVVLESE
ncbi:protein phosphatase 2C domain-containing protein [Roseofilum sp. BLCC_M154]|uniref:Protein phosphatase 2C domain-containing protein n=1 Tax=Roseofilum acuticapitatum BLCC-M154 TaxID=3022444 RepID=A0ABT7API9_9CYAN|nr:protein phosphatase 2C domain-containing protein [Roseofilum acuticapitatum]MDJ1168805.1 protein phosphatase 2C domain-containing protein [Roseofilum acuticapitatum BLCC-M154]